MIDDLISRQAAIEAMNRLDVSDGVGISSIALGIQKSAISAIKQLPFAQFERKNGKWIKQNPFVDTEECSLCKYNIYSEEYETPFCPWCGAEMSERREDEKIH